MDKEDLTLPVQFQYYCPGHWGAPGQLWPTSVLWVPGWFDKEIICPLTNYIIVALHAFNPGDFAIYQDLTGLVQIHDYKTRNMISTGQILSDFLKVNNLAVSNWKFGWTNKHMGTINHVSII